MVWKRQNYLQRPAMCHHCPFLPKIQNLIRLSDLKLVFDDYVTKPFSNRELKVKALLRRSWFAADLQLENEADTEIVMVIFTLSRCLLLVQKATKNSDLDPS